MKDKLNQKVLLNDYIAIAQVKLSNGLLKLEPTLVFARVLSIGINVLSIKYDSGEINDQFDSSEFVIVSRSNNNDTNYESLEKFIYGGLVSV